MERGLFFCASSFDSPPVPAPGATTSQRRSGSPDSVLLDKVAFLADRRNGTTAEGFGRTGQAVQVSFWLADPPGLSHLCVHCPGLNKADFAEEPFIVCADKNIAILHVCFSFGPKDDASGKGLREYFVYRAHYENPSLDLLPNPSPYTFEPREFGLLPCFGGGLDFLIAVLRPKVLIPDAYDLHVFSSKTWTWSTKLAILDPQAPRTWGEYLIHSTDKVITLPRDTLGFVDLCNGILLCSMCEDTPVVRYIGSPEPIGSKRNTKENPSATRDVTFSHGLIKFIEIAYRKRQVPANAPIKCNVCMCSTIGTNDIYDGWDAVTWNRSIFSDLWVKDCEFCVDDITINNPRHLDTLPDLRGNHSGKAILNRQLVLSTPTVSMLDEGVCHLMYKGENMGKSAWILAINMKKKWLEGLASFSADRARYFCPLYHSCALSKYMSMAPRISQVGCKRKRRDGAKILPVDTTILMHGLDPWTTEDQLRDILSTFGELHILRMSIPANQQYASVQFANRSCAEKAMQLLNGAICGRLKFALYWGSGTPKKQLPRPKISKWHADAISYRPQCYGAYSYGSHAAQGVHNMHMCYPAQPLQQ